MSEFQLAAVTLVVALLSAALLWQLRDRQPLPALPDPAATPDPDLPLEPPSLFAALSSALDDAVLVIESDRRISFANEAAPAMIGHARTDLRGRTLMAALRDYQADQVVERAFTSGEQQSATLQTPRTGRTLRLTCHPLAEPDPRAVVVLRDMTQLAHLERARREMVANVSHELATPLASVRLLVETLAVDPPPEVARKMLGQIDDELTQMTQLIDELRELSQIESGRLALRLRPVPIPDLVERALARMRQQAERRDLTLQAHIQEGLPSALVDEDRIGQVLLNLLHNAVKWTPTGGTITVAAMPAAPSDERIALEMQRLEGSGWLRINVEDTGVGIPAEDTERVFERFYKVDRARTRDRGGTGLGLAIAKHLVESHGGRIWVESREGHGSVFSLLLPTP